MQAKLREHIEKIIPLTDEEFVFVISHFSFRKVKKHQFLIQEGDPVNHSYFVVSPNANEDAKVLKTFVSVNPK